MAITSADTLTIQLSPDTYEALLADARIHGKEPAFLAAELLAQQYGTKSNDDLDSEDPDRFWNAMTEEEKQIEIEAIKEGIADFEAGRFISQAEAIQRMSQKHGIPIDMFHASLRP